MKNKHYTVHGKIGGDTYRAEIHPQEHVILCSSGVFGGLLKNADTERRASDIAKRALLEHGRPVLFDDVPLFKGWLFVEVQTCFEYIRLAKVTGLKAFAGRSNANYRDLSPADKSIVVPLIPGFLARLKSEDGKMVDTISYRKR